MKDVYVVSGQVITSLGFTIDEHFQKLEQGATGITRNQTAYVPDPFFASFINSTVTDINFSLSGTRENYTRLEMLMIMSISSALKESDVSLKDADTLLIISTTKGNIDVLEKQNREAFTSDRAYLSVLASTIGRYFDSFHKPVVVCNACISGVLGIIHGSRLIREGKYKNVVVCGGDIISAFTVSGFWSFKAFGTGPCKPYDAGRDGLSLGEGAGTMVLSAEPHSSVIKVAGGSVSNDANHISGPSRTGDGLLAAIVKSMNESSLKPEDMGYISAHGTATMYNDEMESLAIHDAGLTAVPVNSFKGAIGHTLGAAGVIESVLAVESLKRNRLLPSTGFETGGVTRPINVIKTAAPAKLVHVLKTASGFGGCNAAVIFSKNG